MEMNQAAREANARLQAQRDIWRAGEPTRDMHETLKKIELLLGEMLLILQQNQNPNAHK